MAIQIEKKEYPKKLIAIVACAVIVTGLVICSLFAVSDVVSVDSGGDVVVSEGMTVSDVSWHLKEQGIIKFSTVFRVLSRSGGYDKNIKPGRVRIEKGMSYKEILEELVNAVPDGVKVTIPEGFQVNEIAERLSGLMTEEEFYDAVNNYDYDYRFLKGLPEREVRLEGYLFPATYLFTENMTPPEIINEMLKAFDEHFPEEYYQQAEKMGMTVDEIVTLASIVERESASQEEDAKIAGVFYNRLNKNMRLQSCATVQYILKERKQNLSTADTKINSPYNTYVNDGLPVGPIASPGDASIKAALYPENTDALYFVLGSDGKHIFSETFEEHVDAKNNG